MAGNGKGDQNGRAMRIDPALVRELAELLDQNGLTEIEVEDGDRKIKVCRDPAPIYAAAPAPVASAPGSAAAAPSVPPAASEAGEAAAPVEGNAVKSPMVGTAYMSAEPGSKPFVAVGDTVKAGDTLLIVEAMKVMNPITAPAAGTVKQILVADAQPVEFDQPLVILG